MVKEPIKAIAIDDEKNCLEYLNEKVRSFNDRCVIVSQASTIEDGIECIEAHTPQIVFLDIEFPNKKYGFEIFEHFQNPTFSTIFTTAYDKYALRALKLSAVDYLLKPIRQDELEVAIGKAAANIEVNSYPTGVGLVANNYFNDRKKIYISTPNGAEVEETDNIVRLKSDGNYTTIHICTGKKFMVSNTLKHYESMLKSMGFIRINRSDLVNVSYIKKVKKGRYPVLELEDGTTLKVSDRKRSEIISIFN